MSPDDELIVNDAHARDDFLAVLAALQRGEVL